MCDSIERGSGEWNLLQSQCSQVHMRPTMLVLLCMVDLWSIQAVRNRLLGLLELIIWGDWSIKSAEEVGQLVMHPECSANCLHSGRRGSHARHDTQSLFLDGLGHNRTLKILAFVHQGRNWRFENDMPTQIKLLLVAKRCCEISAADNWSFNHRWPTIFFLNNNCTESIQMSFASKTESEMKWNWLLLSTMLSFSQPPFSRSNFC